MARLFTVRMPCTVSTITEPLCASAVFSLPITRRSAGKNAAITKAISKDPPSTIQASVACIQNKNGSRKASVIRSRKVPISLPVRNSRTFQIWPSL